MVLKFYAENWFFGCWNYVLQSDVKGQFGCWVICAQNWFLNVDTNCLIVYRVLESLDVAIIVLETLLQITKLFVILKEMNNSYDLLQLMLLMI